MSNAKSQRPDNVVHPGQVLWIVLNNVWTFLVTVGIAYLLISYLGTGKLAIDASKWPAFSGASTNQTTTLDSYGGKGDPETPTDLRETLHGEEIRGILLLVTYLFIFLNTAIFLRENRKTAREKDDWHSTLAWYVAFSCELLAFSWLFKIVHGWGLKWTREYLPNRIGEWVVTFPDELIALFIFLLFTCVDCLNWRAYAARPAKTPNDQESEESQFALNQALFVDMPVVVGILISVFLADHLIRRFHGSDIYVSGFFSGATVMHLAASQMIYSILACRKNFSIARRKT